MQPVSSAFLDIITGSFRPLVIVDAWYDGRLIYPDVPVVSAEVSFDAARDITGACALEVSTEDPDLMPVDWDSPLSPFGSEIQIRVGVSHVGGIQELLSLGWYRLETCEPERSYGAYRLRDGTTRRPLRAINISAEGADRLAYVEDARLLAPEQPASLQSVKEEIARLCQGLIPPGDWAMIPDVVVPRSIAYEESRLSAIQQLASVLDRIPRAAPDGTLGLYPANPGTTPVWKVDVPDSAVSWSFQLSREGLYNAVVAKGEADENIQGVATETQGPLRWGGPFGMKPYGYASPLLYNNTMAAAAATTRLENLSRNRVMDVQVISVANPALELGDVITVETESFTITGPVSAISIPIPLETMTTTISVPRTEIWGY